MPPAFEASAWDDAPPISHYGGGSYFSQELGTTLRLRYSTESYGQDRRGNFDIGTMQVFPTDNGTMFFDGQVTLNDVKGVGFNLGVGYRWFTMSQLAAFEPERISGVSLWADGSSTEAGNFYPQVGVSLESLGDMWDLRANGYIPIGSQDKLGDFELTGETGFIGNSIASLTRATLDSSYYVAELEAARRLGAERDAWAFAGPYFVGNDDDSTVGYRAGVRGYAYPDLLVQFAVSDDDVFDTYATVSVVWFVGRTRTDYQPTCGLPDRFREPVLRNDYVATSQATVDGGIPLTAPDGSALRFVHIDSDAAAGGDGTFENPLNDLGDIQANSFGGDIVLAWADSTFANQSSAMLRDDQRFLGEGDDFMHTVATLERGTILIPETSPGSQSGPRPLILDALGDAITLAAANEVTNFDIDGGTRAINSSAASEGNFLLRELAITNTTAGGIRLADITGAVTVNNVDFTDGAGFGLEFINFGTDASANVSGYMYNGVAAAAGGISLDNYDGTFNIADSELTGGTLSGARIIGGSDGTFTFAEDVTFEAIAGTAFEVDGFTGTLTMNSDIDNVTGRSVSIRNVSQADTSLTFTGDVTDMGAGILVADSTNGTILFLGDMELTTGLNDAILLSNNNNNVDTNFAGELTIETTAGRGFVSDSGGTITASTTTNTVRTETGTAVEIVDSTISPLGVNFSEVNVTVAGADHAIFLEDNTGGPIVLGQVGDAAGESGVIEATTSDSIVVNNSANVTISGLEINNTNNVAGVSVTKTTAGVMTLNLNDLQINDGDVGIDVTGGGAGAGNLNMSINDTEINSPALIGMRFDNVDNGNIQVNDTTIDGDGAATTAGVLITGSNANFTFDADTTIEGVAGTAFDVDGGSVNIAMNGDITNTSGRSIHIRNITGGNVTMLGEVNDTGTGIAVTSNSGGNINLLGDYTLSTGANDGVTITNNTGANIDVDSLDITTTSGAGLTATGGGTLTVLGTTNDISTQTGIGLDIRNMTIGGAGANFRSVSVDGAEHGVRLENNTVGTVTVGTANNDPGDGGTLANTTDSAVRIVNTNATLNGVEIMNSSTGTGDAAIEIEKTTAAAMTVGLNDVEIDTGSDGIQITGTAASGNFNVNSQGGSVSADGTAIEVTGRLTNVSLAQDITNTTGRSIHIHDVTEGAVTHTGNVTDSGEGILIADNTGGDINLLGSYNLNTGANDAVTVTNNTGALIDFAGLNINTTSGAGFTATGGGTLTVLGATNDITTTTGTGLEIRDMTIGGAGANFRSVSVDGATNGVILENLTGGAVNIGTIAGASGSGGTLNTTGDAISVTNVQNVNLRHVSITNAGGDGVVINHSNTGTTAMNVVVNDLTVNNVTGTGMDVTMNNANSFGLQLLNSTINSNVEMSGTGAGSFGLFVENTTVNTGVGNDVAFALEFSGALTTANVTLRDVNFISDDASSFFMDSFGGTVKSVNFLVHNGSTFTNDSNDATFDVISRGGTRLNATVHDNSFTNAGAGRQFNMTNSGASSRIRLDLEGNDANAGLGDFNLNVPAGTFELFQRTDTLNDVRNSGTVVTDPNDAAFGETLAPVPLPTFP